MRPLSPDEAHALRAMADIIPNLVWTEDDPDAARWDAVHEALVARGCAVVRAVKCPEDDDYAEADDYFITDLGRLALRVAIAGGAS